jgi:hypothetical protein
MNKMKRAIKIRRMKTYKDPWYVWVVVLFTVGVMAVTCGYAILQ